MKLTKEQLLRTSTILEKKDNSKLIKLKAVLKKEFNIDLEKFHDKLKGGKADKITINDMLKISPSTYVKGIKIELEHTKKPILALEIVLDHLFEKAPESFKYYDLLKDMENKMEKG